MASHRTLRPYGLERFSLGCAKRMLERHPGWMPFLRPVEEEQDGLLVRTLAFDLPSENSSVSEPLSIRVDVTRIVSASWFSMDDGRRWSVDWVDFMPVAFERPKVMSEEESLDRILDWIDRLLDERIAALWCDDGPHEGVFGIVNAEDVRSGSFRQGRRRTEIRSWRGALDRVLEGG